MSKDKRQSEADKASGSMREWLDGLASPSKDRQRIEGTLSDLLRAAIKEHGNLLRIEKDTGVHRAALRRFARGDQSIRLDLADKLASYFDIVSRREP